MRTHRVTYGTPSLFFNNFQLNLNYSSGLFTDKSVPYRILVSVTPRTFPLNLVLFITVLFGDTYR